MGGLCSTLSSSHGGGMAYSASVRVAADADTMWSILSDLQASANAVEVVQSFAYVNNEHNKNNKFAVGTVVEEVRAYKGKAITCRRQIVDIVDTSRAASSKDMEEQQPPPPKAQVRSVSFSTSTTDASMMMINRHISNTSTLTVVALPLPENKENHNDSCCELVGTMAFSSSGNGFFVSMCLSCWKLCHYNFKPCPLFIKELQDLAAAAEAKMISTAQKN